MNKNVKQIYCPSCRKEVPVTGGTGLFSGIIGTLMFFLGGAPGARQSKSPRCSIWNSQIPAV